MPKKILIVDDHIDFRKTISELLNANGFDTDTVNDGQFAFEKMYNNRYDLILLDINMPGVSGKIFLEHLKMMDLKIPVFVISGWGVPEIQNDFFELGAVGFLTKPLRHKALIMLIENFFFFRNNV